MLVRVTYARETAVTSFEEAIPLATTPKEILGESPEAEKKKCHASSDGVRNSYCIKSTGDLPQREVNATLFVEVQRPLLQRGSRIGI